jgi:hypothetical protein
MGIEIIGYFLLGLGFSEMASVDKSMPGLLAAIISGLGVTFVVLGLK